MMMRLEENHRDARAPVSHRCRCDRRFWISVCVCPYVCVCVRVCHLCWADRTLSRCLGVQIKSVSSQQWLLCWGEEEACADRMFAVKRAEESESVRAQMLHARRQDDMLHTTPAAPHAPAAALPRSTSGSVRAQAAPLQPITARRSADAARDDS